MFKGHARDRMRKKYLCLDTTFRFLFASRSRFMHFRDILGPFILSIQQFTFPSLCVLLSLYLSILFMAVRVRPKDWVKEKTQDQT